jgi:nucleotide-binding universal stress UspA family protein
MIKSVLVPVDLAQTDAGAASIVLARDVAEKYGSTLTLLHVVEKVPAFIQAQLPAGAHAKAIDDAKTRLDAFAAEHGLAGSVELVTREGSPATEILEFANEARSDMIVIASHDPGLADYLLGSVAARVVRHAHCSVLVVRHRRD